MTDIPAQLAIGQPGKVTLWCHVNGEDQQGFWNCLVINGAWDLKVNPTTGSILPHQVLPKDCYLYQEKVVWQGEAPFHEIQYNEAIDWLNKETQ